MIKDAMGSPGPVSSTPIVMSSTAPMSAEITNSVPRFASFSAACRRIALASIKGRRQKDEEQDRCCKPSHDRIVPLPQLI